MTIRIDPEESETEALFALADLDGAAVLEVGCGDGRLTFRYADRAGHVTAIEPFEGSIARAAQRLREIGPWPIEFRHASFEAFAAGHEPDVFDVAVLSWSLC
jgi:ubiquinone/menaquinone biosynthesis C-methylase UbiE